MIRRFLDWWFGKVRMDKQPPTVNGKSVNPDTPAGQRVLKAAAEFQTAMDDYLASVGEA